jgi:hypothetical protein
VGMQVDKHETRRHQYHGHAAAMSNERVVSQIDVQYKRNCVGH